MKKNNLLIKLLTLLIIIAAVLPVFYMPAYAVEEEYGTQDISDHGISESNQLYVNCQGAPATEK